MSNLNQDLQSILNDLTPEERSLLAKATPADWAQAGAELVVDPSFWGEIAAAFVEGMARGFDKRR